MAKEEPRLNLIIGNLTFATLRNPSRRPFLKPIHLSKRVNNQSQFCQFLDFSI
jgi:hypothetical protein